MIITYVIGLSRQSPSIFVCYEDYLTFDSLIEYVLPIPIASPRLFLHPGPSYVREADNITLPACHVTGHPEPDVTWRWLSGRVPPGRSDVKGNSLTIRSAQKGDIDAYFCEASNLLGTEAARTFIVVVGLPRFSEKPPVKYRFGIGTTMKLDCSAVGDPEPVINWRKEGERLPPGRTVVIGGSLTINNLKKEDSGAYVCIATSAVVSNMAVAQVQVFGKRDMSAVENKHILRTNQVKQTSKLSNNA